MELTDKSFVVPKDFDAEEYYANTVGIFVNEELKPQKVVLRVYGVHVVIYTLSSTFIPLKRKSRPAMGSIATSCIGFVLHQN